MGPFDPEPTLSQLPAERLRKPFSWRAQLLKRVPILEWLPKYNRSAAVADAIAGTTVGLTMIAQSIAYAALAELPSHYGLYSAFVGTLVYVVLGTIKEVSIGPTSLNSLLTLQYTAGRPLEYVVVLTFVSGTVQLLMGVFQLGFIVDFISVPVTAGFLTASALIIAGAQLKNFFGISYTSKRFVDALYELYVRLGQSRPGDMWLSLGCCLFLAGVRALQAIPLDATKPRRRQLKTFLWYLGISSNCIVVLVASILAYTYADADAVPFRLSGAVEPGLPAFHLPAFQFAHQNQTIGFVQVIGDLGSGIVVVPLVALLANVAVAKAMAVGCTVDATQEMLTLGVCNVLGACFGSMPTGGAFTRSAVIRASGVRTPMVGVYSALMVVLALSVLTPYFYYIPRATLAAVLVLSVIFMIDFGLPLRLWRMQRSDFWAWLLTITVCLGVGIEIGLFAGVLLTLGRLVYMWARPPIRRSVRTLRSGQYISVDTMAGMFYPSADWLREKAHAAAQASDFGLCVVVQCERFTGLDYTSAQALCGLAADLGRRGQRLVLMGLRGDLRPAKVPESLVFCAGVGELERFLSDWRGEVLGGVATEADDKETEDM